MTDCAWLWIYAGAGLMLLELVVPGFILCFFGLSAATVGVCRFLFGEAFTSTWQLATFSVFAILYLAVLRRWLKSVFSGRTSESAGDFDSDYIGRTGRITQAVKPPAPGRVQIGDAEWNAESDAALEPGTEVRVVAQSNLTMRVAAL